MRETAPNTSAFPTVLALPYALTVIVLGFFGGQGRDPSALGIPYTRS